jgi:hypothetical protein
MLARMPSSTGVVLMSKKRYETLKRLHSAHGELNYSLEVFGDEIAKREGYKSLSGLDAIYFYLIHKFSWLPRDVRAMTPDDLRLVLSQEMEGWSLPADARVE